MKIDLTVEEGRLLRDGGIPFDRNHEYTEEEALELLDRVRGVENSFSQFVGGVEEKRYFQYGDIADRIHAQIPED